jgi:hypothetical protein
MFISSSSRRTADKQKEKLIPHSPAAVAATQGQSQ